MMATAAAILIRKEKDVVRVYRLAGSTSPAAARTPDDLGVHHRVAFDILVRREVLRDVGDGRYYLDEARWAALRVMRRRLAAGILIIVIATFLLFVVTGIVTVGFGIPRLH